VTKRLSWRGLGRWDRPLALALLLLAVIQASTVVLPAIGQTVSVGRDLDLYLEATRRWMAGGPFYPAHELSGPYHLAFGDILYPPYALVLFVPFTYLPAFLWWAIPLGILVAVVASWTPSMLAVALITVCATFPNTIALVLNGNPVLWVGAAIALGTWFRWPSVLAALKPSVGFVALIWARNRRWRIAAAAGLGVAALFAPLWPDYISAIEHARTPLGPFYSLGDLVFVLIPIVARLGRIDTRPKIGTGLSVSNGSQ
jgi:hypothetical protein